MQAWKNWLAQWKGERGVRLVMILGAAGLALILLSGLFSSSEGADAVKTEESVQTDAADELTAYCEALETQLSDMLEKIDGVGTCQVMVTASGTQETVYAHNTQTDVEENRNQSQQSVVILDQSDGESALIEQVLPPEISGVLVVCSGASSSVVKERVVAAVQTVFDLPSNWICVAEGKT